MSTLLPETAFIEGVSNDVVITALFCLIFFGFAIKMFIDSARNSGIRENDSDESNTPPEPLNTEMCPICRNSHTFAIETNCAHLFCGACLLLLFESDPGHYHLGLRCPMCREQVKLLFKCFSNDDRNETENEHVLQRTRISGFINRYNRRFGDETRSILDCIYDMPMLLRHYFNEIRASRFENILLAFRLYIVLTLSLIYVIIPTDIMPEAVFGIVGLIDDLLMICLVLYYLSNAYRYHIVHND